MSDQDTRVFRSVFDRYAAISPTEASFEQMVQRVTGEPPCEWIIVQYRKSNDAMTQ